MKYYCENCGTTIKTGNQQTDVFVSVDDCPYCDNDLVEIPLYETVEQWEARMGNKYPDTAPVYYLYFVANGDEPFTFWKLDRCRSARENERNDRELIVAAEAGAPPDDWRPK